MAGILIYSDKNQLASELLTAARLIAKDTNMNVKALVLNNDAQAEELAGRGAEVYQINHPEIQMADTAALAAALQQATEKLDSSIILLSSNRRGKELAGRLAQKLAAGSLSDVSGLQVSDGKIQCTRNALGGATLATQQIDTEKAVIALAARSYEAAAPQEGGQVKELVIDGAAASVKLLETKSKTGDSADIQEAEILVVIGQGVEQSELPLAKNIAQKLGGEIACSKPIATDKKWLPEDRIVGLSGKKCKPQLAIILGVSGQVQFTVGIREASTIVAVNNDENAYMLQMADYAMVADAKQVLTELSKALG